MPSCMLLFGEMNQLVHNAVLGVAAICGNNSAASASILSANPLGIDPSQFVSAPDPDILSSITAESAPDPSLSRGRLVSHTEFSRLERVILQQNGVQSIGDNYFFSSNRERGLMAALNGSTSFSADGTSVLHSGVDGSHQTENRRSSLAKLQTCAAPPDINFSAEGVDIPNITVGLTSEKGLIPEMESESGAESGAVPRGGLTLTGGYSSIEGISVGGEIARKNLFGPGSELAAAARYSKIRTLYELVYTETNLAGTHLAFGSTLFANRLSATGFGDSIGRTPFNQSARGINILLNRKFNNGLSATASYRLSDDVFRLKGKATVCDAAALGSPICGEIGKRTRSVLSVALTFDEISRNSGNTHRFQLRLVQDLSIGGSATFTRTRLSSQAHIGLGGGLKLSFEAEGGFIKSIGNDKVPLFDRFYIGDSSMRGFDLRGIGPKIRPAAALPGQNVAIGGRIYYVARTELSANLGGIFGAYRVQPSIFIDAGSVFGANKSTLLSGETLFGNEAKPRVAVGMGITLNTPAGKLRFDIVKPLIKQEGDRAKLISISFGSTI